MSTKQKKIPKKALCLAAPNSNAFAEASTDEKKRLNMTVYSGGVIKGHYWWGDLAIDLEGIKFDRSRYPVLEDHWTSKKIGFSRKPVVDGKVTLDPETTKFVSTDASREFQKVSNEGFPFQASMYAIPSIIERVVDGETAEVNGFTFKGPGTIWRKCLYQEASVCVFGWDNQTNSAAFAKDEVDVEYTEIEREEVVTGVEEGLSNDNANNNKEKEVISVPITLEQLQKDAPDLLQQIQDTAVADADKKFQKEKSDMQTEIDKLKKTNETLESDKEGLTERVDKLEKANIKKERAEQLAIGEATWDAQLAASEFSEKYRGKIRLHVRPKDFLDDDGKLDTDKFTKAVVDEIEEWDSGEPTVIGGGSGGFAREPDSEAKKKEKLAKENKERSDKLLAHAGQPQKKDAA